MKFQNALAGVKLIILAEIFALAASVLLILSRHSIISFLTNNSVLLFAGLSIAAFVIQIIGITRCSKEDYSFNSAIYAIIAGIVFNFASGFAASSISLSVLLSLAASIASICATVFIIKGFINIANYINRTDVASFGSKLIYLVIASGVISIISSIVSIASRSTANTMTLISGLFGIAELIVFIVFLYKSEGMLVEHQSS